MAIAIDRFCDDPNLDAFGSLVGRQDSAAVLQRCAVEFMVFITEIALFSLLP
jgi:hypothetical protein